MNMLVNDTFPNETNGGLNNSLINSTVSTLKQSSDCLPSYIIDAMDVTTVYVSDIVLTVVNIPSAIFAFLSNLAVIVTIIRTPSLHVPVNVLLCGLAAADCLTGLIVQPVYASWRVLLHHLRDPCTLVHLYQASKSLPFLLVGCTFLNLAITSVDRFYAVSKPFAYRTVITFQGMVKIVVASWVLWSIYVGLLETVVPSTLYDSMENATLASLIIIPTAGHVLTFLAVRRSSRYVLSLTHSRQHTTLFEREKKAAANMALYTLVTLASLVPLMILLNFGDSVVAANILFPWASTVTMLVSSINPVIQIQRNRALREALKNQFN